MFHVKHLVNPPWIALVYKEGGQYGCSSYTDAKYTSGIQPQEKIVVRYSYMDYNKDINGI